ncbi:sensor histidine kinase [Culicoidibacter larvae]|uniref:histidine kinase n=1 Tax=Culicoidibacter larvae TaxID=2579976 RepID=A0A5R8QFY8_9FIRM|nr:ATP-binding protein [Culicoidibacter larvae]TLG75383.1 HAMP domain-containing protein [Culicoidibacter larvae]
MFKSIAVKLTSFFVISILIFSALFIGIFTIIFNNYAVDYYKIELNKKATAIAETFSPYLDKTMSKEKSGLGSFMKYLNQMEAIDIWIFDSNQSLFTIGNSNNSKHLNHFEYSDLPDNADEFIKQIFQNELAYSESFNQQSNILTIAKPIFNQENELVGAVLLQAPVSLNNGLFYTGLIILLGSMGLALLVSIILSILLSKSFTRPLKIINNNTLLLKQGQYEHTIAIKNKDEIGELATSINDLATKLAEAEVKSKKEDIARKEFIASISHELRTPLTVIRGLLEAINDQVIITPEEITESHNQILAETVLMQRLVTDLLELSRLQNANFSIANEPVDVLELLNDISRSSTALAAKKNIKLNIEIQIDRLIINGDYDRIRQMLIIIIDNAIKYSYNNSEIDIVLLNDKISIQDYGIGIDSEQISHIFDKFFILENDQKSGTGLGLAIAKEIAERHNFKIDVKSKLNKGTTFDIYF